MNTVVHEIDDYADLLDDPHFWARTVDMPSQELEPLLRTKLRINSERMQGTTNDLRFVTLHRRLKDEIMVATDRNRQFPIRNAIVAVFGTGAYDQLHGMVQQTEARLHEDDTVNSPGHQEDRRACLT